MKSRSTRPRLAETPGEEGGVQAHPDPAAREKNVRLEELETIVARHRLSWWKAGKALREIKDSELFRDRAKETFDEYLEKWLRWGVSRRHAYSLIEAAGVADNLKTAGVNHGLSIRAAVVLAKLPSERQAECLRECIAGKDSLSPPSEYVAAAVAARLGSPTRKRGEKTRKKKQTLRRRFAGGVATVVIAAGVDLRAVLLEWLAEIENPSAPKPASTPRT